MRVLADLKSLALGQPPEITEVQRTPDSGSSGRTAINGRFALSAMRGADFTIGPNDHVLPVDGMDVSSRIYAGILASYPMFQNVLFNPLLQASDLLDFDLAAQFKWVWSSPPIYYFPTRAQLGRAPGWLDSPTGLAPMMVAVLAMNAYGSPSHPGCLITQEFTLPAMTGTPWVLQETSKFMVYWKTYGFDVTHDLAADSGGTPGNAPSVRYLKEIEQEPADFAVYFTPDDGANWYPVGLLEPLHLCKPTSKFRLAFLNGRVADPLDDTMGKAYLATFGVLY